MTDYMCPADPTVTHCYHAAKVNEIIRAHVSEITTLRAEVERLKAENILMHAALSYGILEEDERHILPSNPFKCGTCDASKHLRAEVERLRAVVRDIHAAAGNNHHIANIARAALEESK